MATLRVTSGPAAGTSVEVDRELIVGREGTDVPLPDSEVSRRHVSIRPADGGVTVEDLGSMNGTLVNGRRLDARATLTETATLQLGDTQLTLEVAPTRAPARPGGDLRRVLRVTWGPASGEIRQVDREILIGRGGADLAIEDPEVSRRHALIRPVEEGVEVEDLGSTNGTFLGDRRIEGRETLTESAKITVGSSEMLIELWSPGGTRIGMLGPAPVVDRGTRARATFAPESAVALRITEAEQAEAQAAPQAVAAAATPSVATALPPLAARFGIGEANRRWWTLAAMCLGLAMLMLDTTVVNVALPAIQEDLDASLTGLQWTVSAYTLAFAALLVTGGRAGDIYGRRRVFLMGAVIFTTASAAVGAAQSQEWLIAARAAQGMGAAFMMPGTLSIITNTFPSEERAKAIGIWAGVSGIALALGPVVGGLLTTGISWRWVFYLNLPLAAAAIGAALLAAPESRDEGAPRSLDVLGIVTLSSGLAALVLAIIQSTDWGWGSPAVLGLIGAGAAAMCAFVAVERRVAAPMVELEFFRSSQFAGAVLAAITLSFALLGILVYLAIYMQNVLGYSALETGLRFLPGTVMIGVVSPQVGRLAGRVPLRYLLATGLGLIAVAAGIETFITPDTGYALLLPSLIALGLGLGFALPPLSTAAMNAVRREKAGAAAGMVSMGRQLGAALGVAVVGAVFQSASGSNAEEKAASLGLADPLSDAVREAAEVGTPDIVRELPLDPNTAAATAQAVSDAVADAVATALVVPAAVALAGALAVLFLVRARPDRGEPGSDA